MSSMQGLCKPFDGMLTPMWGKEHQVIFEIIIQCT